MIEEQYKKWIIEYQCSGCVCGSNAECYVKDPDSGISCDKHCAGTTIYPIVGRIFLGMPRAFFRLGAQEDLKIKIFLTDADRKLAWNYDIFNVPTWKYKNKEGHIFVRGMCPRINWNWLHIILDGDIDAIRCYQITEKDMKEMD
jgi:hypothetical protein